MSLNRKSELPEGASAPFAALCALLAQDGKAFRADATQRVALQMKQILHRAAVSGRPEGLADLLRVVDRAGDPTFTPAFVRFFLLCQAVEYPAVDIVRFLAKGWPELNNYSGSLLQLGTRTGGAPILRALLEGGCDNPRSWEQLPFERLFAAFDLEILLMAAERVSYSEKIADPARQGLLRRWRRYRADLRDVRILGQRGWQIAAPWQERVENQRRKLVEMVRFRRYWETYDRHGLPKDYFQQVWKDQTARGLVIQEFIVDAQTLQRMMAAVAAPSRPKL